MQDLQLHLIKTKLLLVLLNPGGSVLQKTELAAKVCLREGLVVKTMEN